MKFNFRKINHKIIFFVRMSEVPKTMKAIFVKEDKTVELREVNTPIPGYGEVLVKVFASPINPSDMLFIEGKYPFNKKRPCVPGFESAGLIVQNGGGLFGWSLIGKRVACKFNFKISFN